MNMIGIVRRKTGSYENQYPEYWKAADDVYFTGHSGSTKLEENLKNGNKLIEFEIFIVLDKLILNEQKIKTTIDLTGPTKLNVNGIFLTFNFAKVSWLFNYIWTPSRLFFFVTNRQ